LEQFTTKLYNTFTKGLITEASPLNTQQQASTDENNCVLLVKANRPRRLGIDYETSHHLTNVGLTGVNPSTLVVQEYKWVAVNQENINFLVVQVNGTLYFYSMDSYPISGNQESYTVDLTAFTAPFSTDSLVAGTPVSMTSGQGFLFVSSSQIEPFVVHYTGSSMSSTQLYIQIRDFTGLNDGLAPDEEIDSESSEHLYNLKNQGWNTPNCGTTAFGVNAPLYDSVSYFDYTGTPSTYDAPGDAPIIKFLGDFNLFPANNKQWWVAITQEGGTGDGHVWTDTAISSFSAGNTLAPRGHYILNAFNQDYSAYSGVSGLTANIVNIRPPTISFFSGRVWYAAGTTVYYSQILTPQEWWNAGKCFQLNDPTDQTINNLIASDGGVIQIPEMGQAVKVSPIGTGIMVFATNGVWFIGGGAGAFSATDIAITKISGIGMNSPFSVVSIDSDIYWWSDVGIQGLSQKSGIFGPVQGNVDKLNITETTIKTFYFNSISTLGITNAKAVYDPATNCITWLFQSPELNVPFLYDRMLNFNLTTNGFFPYQITMNGSGLSGTSITQPFVCGVFPTLDNNVIPSQKDDRRNTYLNFLTIVPSGGNMLLTVSLFNSNSFMDWKTFNGVGFDFASYIETHYELTRNWSNFEVDPNAIVKKTAPWIVTYFMRTEENFVGNETNGYTVDLPSSCYLTAQWDWSSSAVSNKWYGPYQVYKLQRLPYPDASNLTLDTGYVLVQGRFKVRGMGKALQLRFEHSTGCDFNLLGWEIDLGVNARP
jgi:hypothetical protein